MLRVQQQNQHVYLISNKASNYSASPAAAKAAVSAVIEHGRPTAGEAPSIVGGIVYRGPANPLLSGRYVRAACLVVRHCCHN
jgi:hypothetical protein